MKTLIDFQALVDRFNEGEAGWREYERLRCRFPLSTAIPNSLLDRIDWLTAERKRRVVCRIGRILA